MRRPLQILATCAVLILLAYVIGRLFFFDVYQLDHNDMAPTLVAGDQVLVSRHAEPDLGDVVVCNDPSDPARRVVGRIVGIPGATVEIDRGQLKINDRAARTEGADQSRFLLIDAPNRGRYDLERTRELLGNNPHDIVSLPNRRPELRRRRVERGLFLLSDNRSLGRDSRHYGEVNPANCYGRVFLVLFVGTGTGDASTASRQISWVR